MACGAVTKKNGIWAFSVSAGILLIDQLSKLWAVHALNSREISIFWEFRFRLVKNSGTIFGLGNSLGSWLVILVIIVVLLLAALVAGIAFYEPLMFRHRNYLIGYSAILGGALGNLGDRIFRPEDGFGSGSVIDFIDLNWWPVFNVADSAITIGVITILWISFSNAYQMAVRREDIEN